MSKVNSIAIFIVFLFIGTSTAQDDVLKNVSAAMKAGSSKELAKYFHNVVQIDIDGDRSNFNRAQAEVVIKDFFQKHPAIDFEYIHEGASKDGLSYTIGKFSHREGSFRVVMLVKNIGGVFAVDTFTLTSEWFAYCRFTSLTHPYFRIFSIKICWLT